ncbi:peptidase M24, structural domain-containing protein, partial [Blastocladiella britannica]
AAGRLAKAVLNYASGLVKEGTTTAEIDAQVHGEIVRHGAYPSPLQYQGFPKSICTSINNVMAHGIPDNRPLRNGDIINVDVTVYRAGFHGDCSATFAVGAGVDAAGLRLIAATREALDAAIAVCRPGAPMTVIADAIAAVAARYQYSVAPDLCGHGIGREFHAPPIVHHRGSTSMSTSTTTPATGFSESPTPGTHMVPGMAFTIEPVLCQGSSQFVLHPDGWTAVTRDGGRAAQFEETLLMTEDGIEIMT